jgi:hypothetical protein
MNNSNDNFYYLKYLKYKKKYLDLKQLGFGKTKRKKQPEEPEKPYGRNGYAHGVIQLNTIPYLYRCVTHKQLERILTSGLSSINNGYYNDNISTIRNLDNPGKFLLYNTNSQFISFATNSEILTKHAFSRGRYLIRINLQNILADDGINGREQIINKNKVKKFIQTESQIFNNRNKNLISPIEPSFYYYDFRTENVINHWIGESRAGTDAVSDNIKKAAATTIGEVIVTCNQIHSRHIDIFNRTAANYENLIDRQIDTITDDYMIPNL